MLKSIPGIPATIRSVVVAIISCITLVSGCATLSKDECLTADWTTIGFEDGGRGHPASYLSEHREACAKHGVTPDLEHYLQGREEGLLTYCTRGKGYESGRTGKTYQHVCPAINESQFLNGYHLGREEYELSQSIKNNNKELQNLQKALDSMDEDFEIKRQLAASDKTKPRRREQLIDEIIALERDREQTLNEIDYLTQDTEEMQDQLHHMERLHQSLF